MSYTASSQLKGLPNCKMLKFEVRKNGVTPLPIESDLLNKISPESEMADFFSKLKF